MEKIAKKPRERKGSLQDWCTLEAPSGILARVDRPYFQEFLSRFDSQGLFHCPCGRDHRISTRSVLMEKEALENSADLLESVYGKRVALWVLSDENTERAAGARWKEAVRASKIVSRMLPGRPKLVPTAELVELLDREARNASPDLLVGVGSGVISDVVKKVSLDTGIPNWCVATAASVDAYSSATSAIRFRGYHTTVPAAVTETIVCDLGVIRQAPRQMFLAGLGDLLAKFSAHLDWNLSRIMTGEHYCDIVSSAALGSARTALSAARALADTPDLAFRTLVDAVLTSGFTMQSIGGSRPAASGEHTIAHFWEMADAVGNERLDLHGILVGAASGIVLRAYRALFEALRAGEIDPNRRLEVYDREVPWQESLEEGLRPFLWKMREEIANRVFDRAALADRLEAFRRSKREILALAFPILGELASAVEALRGLGYPFSPVELGIRKDFFLLPFRGVRFLRDRYSSFDLAYELGTDRVMSQEAERYAREW